MIGYFRVYSPISFEKKTDINLIHVCFHVYYFKLCNRWYNSNNILYLSLVIILDLELYLIYYSQKKIYILNRFRILFNGCNIKIALLYSLVLFSNINPSIFLINSDINTF